MRERPGTSCQLLYSSVGVPLPWISRCDFGSFDPVIRVQSERSPYIVYSVSYYVFFLEVRVEHGWYRITISLFRIRIANLLSVSRMKIIYSVCTLDYRTPNFRNKSGNTFREVPLRGVFISCSVCNQSRYGHISLTLYPIPYFYSQSWSRTKILSDTHFSLPYSLCKTSDGWSVEQKLSASFSRYL